MCSTEKARTPFPPLQSAPTHSHSTRTINSRHPKKQSSLLHPSSPHSSSSVRSSHHQRHDSDNDDAALLSRPRSRLWEIALMIRGLHSSGLDSYLCGLLQDL